VSLIERAIRERIVLVGVTLPPARLDDTESSLEELSLLVGTAGAEEAGRIVSRRDRPDPATFLGKGKVEELHELCLEVDADTVVFDNELTPAQQFNLEKLLGRTAIDRTAVILDIFAQNAHTLEGKAQVELARLRYRLPRLRRGRAGGSQQAGRIGTRGLATQLETDWRALQRHPKLEGSEGPGQDEDTQRKRTAPPESAPIVGYTNAGKSPAIGYRRRRSIENRCSTLDQHEAHGFPVARRARVRTVGRAKRPTSLRAFKSTLETVVFRSLPSTS
jgi:GTP-binding protein HflX